MNRYRRGVVDQRGPGSDILDAWLGQGRDDRRLWLSDLRCGLRTHPPRIVHPEVVKSRDAAVLLPVYEDPDHGLQVVLIERAADVGTHRGDVAFPGGAVEAGERGRVAAVREAHEEVGVEPGAVEILAALSTHPIIEGFVIWPYIGALRTLPDAGHRSAEVARVLVVSLADLVRDGAWWRTPWPAQPSVVLDYFDVGTGIAWGTTGMLLRELLEISIAGRLTRQREGRIDG